MISSVRAGSTYVAAFLAGVLLFFMVFAAIFNGSWGLLILFLFGYAGAGALAVWAGGLPPVPTAAVLAAPAVPWVLWLFPASIPEAGLARALLWPALLVVAWCLGWLGGMEVKQARAGTGPASGAV